MHLSFFVILICFYNKIFNKVKYFCNISFCWVFLFISKEKLVIYSLHMV